MDMYNYKQILEAVNRGIQLALDDFEDEEQVQNVKSKQVYNRDYTKEYMDLMKEVVDLGFPSGTLWCKYNLGATCKPNYNQSWFGNYYAWGELEPNKPIYDWVHYKFYNGPDPETAKIDIMPEHYITKYIKSLTDIEKQIKGLLPEDDVAYQNKKLYNFKFHIPTKEQAQELLENTKIIYYIRDNSKNPKYEDVQGYTGAGWFMISKINGNYLFFPEAGIKEGNDISMSSRDSGIWTSSLSTSTNCALAIKLHPSFNQEQNSPRIYGFWKYRGLPIRPVVNP